MVGNLPTSLDPDNFDRSASQKIFTNGYIAVRTVAPQGKNRSGLAWFFVSLLLGPIATFLIVVLDKVK